MVEQQEPVPAESAEPESEGPAVETEPEPEVAEPEPEAPTEVAEPQPQAAGELDLSAVVKVWPAVLDQLLQTAPALAASFEGARPVGLEDGELTVGFPAGATFNKRKAEAPDKREQLVGALETVVGQKLRPVYVVLEDGEEAAVEQSSQDAPASPVAASGDDRAALLDKIKSEFDAEEVG